MDRLARVANYAAQRYGDTPEVMQRVLEAFANGTEAQLMTRNQRRRDRQKQHMPEGTHRKGQRARRKAREAARA